MAAVRVEPAAVVLPDWRLYRSAGQLVYSGFYTLYDESGQVCGGIHGRIVLQAGREAAAYIHDPPARLRSLAEGACFQLLYPGSRWFRLHWHCPPRSFEQALAYIDGLMRRL
jgi:hypothetical protein